jgi:hypothetical protein
LEGRKVGKEVSKGKGREGKGREGKGRGGEGRGGGGRKEERK